MYIKLKEKQIKILNESDDLKVSINNLRNLLYEVINQHTTIQDLRKKLFDLDENKIDHEKLMNIQEWIKLFKLNKI